MISKATFAGGCFWCIEWAFQSWDGVKEAVSGYTGGTGKPTYEAVCRGDTGHYEAVQVTFDSAIISYQKLLDIFWANIDPTDAGGQYHDRGSQYKTAIFYHDEEQYQNALLSKETQQGHSADRIQTEILPLGDFFPAEEYHQDYADKNPLRFHLYEQSRKPQ